MAPASPGVRVDQVQQGLIASGFSRGRQIACRLSLNLAKVDQKAKLLQVKGRSQGW